MTNYYEFLGILPSATVSEVQGAIDSRFVDESRKARSFDPAVKKRAEQTQKDLEKIREVLTNPEKRCQYDKSIDYKSKPNGKTPGKQESLREPKPPLSGLWRCPHCYINNETGTLICRSCHKKVGHHCPKQCGNVIRICEKFCPYCGYNVEEHFRKLFQAEQAQRISAVREKIALETQHIQNIENGKYIDIVEAIFTSKNLELLESVFAGIVSLILLIGGVMVLVEAFHGVDITDSYQVGVGVILAIIYLVVYFFCCGALLLVIGVLINIVLPILAIVYWIFIRFEYLLDRIVYSRRRRKQITESKIRIAQLELEIEKIRAEPFIMNL